MFNYVNTYISKIHKIFGGSQLNNTILFLLKPFSLIPMLLMMYIIFSFSAQTGDDSSKLSHNVTYKIVSTADELLDLQLSDSQINRCINKIHHYIRKIAHFSEYFLLAATVSLPLYVYGIRGFWLILTAGIICIGFAVLDEMHQLFVQNRSGSYKDVIIDSLGSITGIIFVRLFGYIIRKTIIEPLCKLFH